MLITVQKEDLYSNSSNYLCSGILYILSRKITEIKRIILCLPDMIGKSRWLGLLFVSNYLSGFFDLIQSLPNSTDASLASLNATQLSFKVLAACPPISRFWGTVL